MSVQTQRIVFVILLILGARSAHAQFVEVTYRGNILFQDFPDLQKDIFLSDGITARVLVDTSAESIATTTLTGVTAFRHGQENPSNV